MNEEEYKKRLMEGTLPVILPMWNKEKRLLKIINKLKIITFALTVGSAVFFIQLYKARW